MFLKIVLAFLISIGFSISVMAEENMQSYELNKNGSINFWMLLLPIANPSDLSSGDGALKAINIDYLSDVGGEINVDPYMEPEPIKGLKWFPRGCGGHVNLWLYTPIKDGVTAYGFCYLKSDADKQVVMKIGSSDPIKIYLNGQKIHENLDERAPSYGQDTVSINLKKGFNKLLVKTSQGIYEWGYMIQIHDSSGKSAAGVETILPISDNDIPKVPDVLPVETGDILPEINKPEFFLHKIDKSIEINKPSGMNSQPVDIAVKKFTGKLRMLNTSIDIIHNSSEYGINIDYISNIPLYENIEYNPSVKALNTPESYIILSYGDKIYLFGYDDMGIVYGLSFLQSRTWKDNNSVYIHLDNRKKTYIPEFKKRGIYVMYGYNYSGIEIHDWGVNEWKSYIDELVLAQLNYIYIYIWTDTWAYMPGTTEYNPRNRKIHETLRSVIRYAHSRGMKVCYMMAPSLLPSSLYDTDRSSFSDKPFVKNWKFACTETESAKILMKKLIRAELEYLKEADVFQIAFFDPGGCGCDKCMKDISSTIMNQIKLWMPIVKEYNRNAEISVNFWPVRVIEDEYKVKFGEETLNRIKNEIGLAVDICEAPEIYRKYLHTAKNMGFKTTAFIFPTNPETSYLLPIISGELWQPMFKQMYHDWNFNSALFQRMEVKTRGLQDWICGNLYYNTNVDIDSLIYAYACMQTTDTSSGYKFSRVLKGIDEFTNIAQESGSTRKLSLGNAINNEILSISNMLPSDKKWYIEAGSLYKYLGEGIYIRNHLDITVNTKWEKLFHESKSEFTKSFKAGKVFGRALQDENVIANYFDSYVDYLALGRLNMLF